MPDLELMCFVRFYVMRFVHGLLHGLDDAVGEEAEFVA